MVKCIHNDILDYIMRKCYVYLREKLRFTSIDHCNAVFLSLWRLPCYNPTVDGTRYCTYHKQCERRDWFTYHLLNKYYRDLHLANMHRDAGTAPDFVREFDQLVESGHDAKYFAAMEHHLRIVYQARYQFSPCENHDYWEQKLRSTYAEYWSVDINGIVQMMSEWKKPKVYSNRSSVITSVFKTETSDEEELEYDPVSETNTQAPANDESSENDEWDYISVSNATSQAPAIGDQEPVDDDWDRDVIYS